MTIDVLAGERKLVINQDYLSRFKSGGELYLALKEDLLNVDGGEVHLHRPTDPRLSSLYCDVRAFVCLKAIYEGYLIKPADEYDAEKVRAILGNNLIGDPEQGYRFHKKS